MIGGSRLSRSEWELLRRDAKELQRFYALHVYVVSRDEGLDWRSAYERAGASAPHQDGSSTNWETVMRWKKVFIQNKGKLQIDMRGHHRKTKSYLDDHDILEQALAYVREEIKKSRQKNSSEAPLTVDKFEGWVNGTLLKELLEEDPKREKVDRKTCYEWLARLGFSFKNHSKSLYYDGHERADVVKDRHEKLAMLKILEEVTVTYVGRDCKEVHALAELHDPCMCTAS